MVALLDINVLVALFNPNHTDHDAAHDWFHNECVDGWASCPVTENGLLRVLGDPGQKFGFAPVPDLLDRLKRFCAASDHHFWADALSFRDGGAFHVASIRGHKQLTDVYLLALAVKNHGRFVTFDAGVPLAAAKGSRREHLEVIEPA